MKAEEYAGLVDMWLTVQQDLPGAADGEDTFREVTGKCVASGEKGLVLQVKGRTLIFEAKDILDVEVIGKRRNSRVSIRWIDKIDQTIVRQHLLDRHGLPLAIVRGLSSTDAMRMHDAVDHEKLGHRHGVRPPGKPGRPPASERNSDS